VKVHAVRMGSVSEPSRREIESSRSLEIDSPLYKQRDRERERESERVLKYISVWNTQQVILVYSGLSCLFHQYFLFIPN
jgi:hypothetical protein